MEEVTKFFETSAEAVRTWGFGAVTSRVHQTLSCLRPLNGLTISLSPLHIPKAQPPPVRFSCVCQYAPQHTTLSLQAALQDQALAP